MKVQAGEVRDDEVAALGLAFEIQTAHSDLKMDIQNYRQRMKSILEKRKLSSASSTSASSSSSSSSSPSSSSNEKNEKEYVTSLSPMSFAEAAMSYESHYHFRQFSPPSRSKLIRIAKEISALSTSLPISASTSVFVRVDQERLDIVRCLISGPQDTPYQNGLFIFDIYFPANYPNSPPLCQLRTTGNGTFRFNPNLYECGKVCLSLLGTWQGPGWDPKNSTLLQVWGYSFLSF
jgi:ubiquitin-protein ligase